MDTLREREISLSANARTQESAVRDSVERSTLEGRGPEYPPIIDTVRRPPEAHCSDRFAPDYIHPDFQALHVRYGTAKRIFDVTIASALLLFAWPLMVLAAILVKLTSRGPAVFRQVRVGRGGRYFTCYKFRSMCQDAEEKKRALQHLNELDGPVFKIRRDPRITPVGAIIRKFSIDELPQLINVLKGDMSIVGPRPPVPSEVEKYTARERGRLCVRPGLTCLWQISGRSDVPFERWIELDLEYIEKMSFATDVRILAMTVPAVLTGAGAH